MRIYNCYVLPMFTYNIATLGITDTQMKRLDVLHRKQLRIVCRIFYPRRIRNIALYKLTESVPITNMALQYRWKFFGHILRQSRENPPYKIMTSYFDPNSGRIPRQGRTFTNLPITLHKDLEYAAGIGRPPLQSMEDLELIRKFAQRRNEWREMVAEMVSKHNQPPTVRTRKTTRKRQRQENKKEMTKRKKEYKRQKQATQDEVRNGIRLRAPPEETRLRQIRVPMTTPRYIWNPAAARAAAQWPDGEPMDLHDDERQDQEQDAEEDHAEQQQEQAAMWHRFH